MAKGKSSKKMAEKSASGFTPEERAAMREYVREAKARPGADPVDGERAVLGKIAAMPPRDRALGERLHAIIQASAPGLVPRTWYGMPAYAKDGQVICFFQNSAKFKSRYSTLGFSDKAKLDDGLLWPTAFAIADLTPELEARVAALVKKAVS